MLSSTNKRPYHRVLCVVFLCSLLLVFVDDAQASSSPTNDDSPTTLLPTNLLKSFVAFGDSNTIPYLPGATSWFTFLERRLRGHYLGLRNATNYARRYYYNFTFTNLSYGAKTIAIGSPNQHYDIQAALNLIPYTDYGIVLLGTNDAWQGIPIADFQNYYRQFIMTVKASGKIGKLFILAVPPMIFPYNCIGDCWRNTHNPQTERVTPFNTFLSSIKTYCAGIGFKCAYINASRGMQLNTTYLNAGDGIHLTNASQNLISANIFNVISQEILPIS